MSDEQTKHPIEVHSVIGTKPSRYRLDAVETESEEATVYRATPLQPDWHGYDHRDTVGDTVFVVVLRHPLSPDIQATTDRWAAARKKMRRAMTCVEPAVAGFPDWNKIRIDDSVKLTQDECGSIHWGAFQVSTYRRRLAKAVSEYRRPLNFTVAARRALLQTANQRCRRCGSEDRLEVDHIIPVGLGGTNQQSNGMVLCHSCHLGKSRAERTAFGLSVDLSSRPGEYPTETFRNPDEYLRVLGQQAGWLSVSEFFGETSD